MNISKVIHNNKRSLTLLMVCFYIFLLIERPWESVRYLHGLPIERTFAILLIFISYLTGYFKIVRSPANKWVYGFAFLHFFLVPFSFSSSFALEQGIDFLKMVVFYLLLLSVIREKNDLKTVIIIYILPVLFYSLHSLIEFLNGRHVYRMGISRMIGVDNTFEDPNSFGASLLLSIPFVYALIKNELNNILRYIYYISLFVFLLCIFLTGSRSAFVGLVSLASLWIIFQKGSKRILISLLVLLSFGFIWNVIPIEKKDRIISIWDDKAGPENAHESAEGRVRGFKAGIEMFKKYPLTGVGPGGKNFIEYRTINLDGIPEQSHNLYAEVLGEFGVGGGILFIGLISSIFACCINAKKIYIRYDIENRFLLDLSNMILVCLFLLLLLGLAGHNFYRPLWLWITAWSGSLWRLAVAQISNTHQTSNQSNSAS